LRRYADAWQAQDLGGLIALYADDFTLHYRGTSRFAGTHRGLDAALGVMAEVSSLAPRELRSIDDVLVSDDGGALVVTERLTRDGRTVELQRVLHYRVEDGLLAECWLLETDQSAVDELWR
jgi:ketosteroid isomerase-like protein